ncbi:MAG: 2-oxoacid:acceptor oxidoreductase family protein [Phycisphaerales bacterium JB039]
MNDRAQPLAPTVSCEIRFESIGGLGAHAAGQILASAAVLRLGLNGAHFSSYGSEKKGSAVKSYVRLTAPDKPIRTSAPIDAPDCIVVFHTALLANPVTLAGLKAGGTLIYTGHPEDRPDLLRTVSRDVRVIRVDAQRIANEEKSRPNAVLLGALCGALDLLDTRQVLAELTAVFEKKHPGAVPHNTRAFERGLAECELIEGLAAGDGDLPTMRPGPVWGYETAPIGGVIPLAGNTITNNLATSRAGYMPVFDDSKCIHCGLCDIVCPDYCIVWEILGDAPVPEATRMRGIDYNFCKGCQRCVETCPTGALTRVEEQPGMADRLRVPIFNRIGGGTATNGGARV